MYSRSSEPVRFERDCAAVLVPQGDEVTLPAGTVGYITQSLGGSWTVFVEGNLMRIAGKDGDAIGKEPPALPQVPDNVRPEDMRGIVWQTLKTCYDPEIPVDIVELGLVYVCDVLPVEDGDYRVSIKMTLTAPGCGMGEILTNEVADKLMALPHIADVQVDLVFDPPWDRCRMSEAAQLTLGL